MRELTFQLRIYVVATTLFSIVAGFGAVAGFFSADTMPFDIPTLFLNSFAFSFSAMLTGICFTALFSLPLLVILNYLVSRLSYDFLIQTRITAIWLAANVSGFYFSAAIMLLAETDSNAGADKFVFWGMLAALVPLATGMKIIVPAYRQLLKAQAENGQN